MLSENDWKWLRKRPERSIFGLNVVHGLSADDIFLSRPQMTLFSPRMRGSRGKKMGKLKKAVSCTFLGYGWGNKHPRSLQTDISYFQGSCQRILFLKGQSIRALKSYFPLIFHAQRSAGNSSCWCCTHRCSCVPGKWTHTPEYDQYLTIQVPFTIFASKGAYRAPQ